MPARGKDHRVLEEPSKAVSYTAFNPTQNHKIAKVDPVQHATEERTTDKKDV